MSEVFSLAKQNDLEILGTVPFDENLSRGLLSRNSQNVNDAINNLYFRLNLPQEN